MKNFRSVLSFQAGEISPRFLGRSDTEIYQKGLETAENVIVLKQGGVRKRGGVEHIGQITGNRARVFTLQVTRQRYYTIILHDLEMVILAAGARLLGNNLLLNGSFASSGANWSTTVTPITSQVNFVVGQVELLPETQNPETIINGDFLQAGTAWIVRLSSPQSDVTFNNNSVTLTPRTQTGGSAGIAQSIATTNTGQQHTLIINGNFGNIVRVRIGTVEADGTYLDVNISASDTLSFIPIASPYFLTIDCEFPEVTAVIDDVSIRDPIIKTSEVSQQATVTAAITDLHLVLIGQHSASRLNILIGTTEGASDIASFVSTDVEITETFVPNNATYWVTVQADGDFNQQALISFIGTAAELATNPLGILMPAPWTEDQLNEVHIIESPEGRKLFFTHPNVPVQQLIYDFATDTFVNLSASVFLSPPVEWTGANHPATGTHYQGRLWLAGTPDQRETIWASIPGSALDFTDSGTSLDSDPIEIVLQEFGRIEWMLGTKNLLVGTENAEHILTSNAGNLTPNDLKIEKQSVYGSNNMQGLQVGEKVFYLTPDGRKLRAMAYEWQEDNWLSQDLTFVSEHITNSPGRFSTWSQNPDSLFGLVLEDGTLVTLTYDRTASTIAWTRLNINGFKILDIASARDNGVDQIVIVGQRTNGMIDIESNFGGAQLLDSYVTAFDAGGTNIITGLDHLEGLQVRPIVDGAIDPLQVVVGGQITTQTTGVNLIAGVPYTAKIKTLPPDVPNDQIRSFKKRWNKVWALMLDSKVPIINGDRPPDRTPSTPMNTVEPDTTGHFKTLNLGWDDFGQITIEQDLPVPMHVVAIYGEMDQETL